ncbi:MAG TPA: MBL fold metallo-hydrolase, partial [Candidatus Marinimicrobia bacterium]|nr:MBL fold metallo-hydrolase [Candidatus Neomarinimicrobiota bacterium]
MARANKMYIRFWGVRGSIATPGKETVRYGGDTSCIEIRCGKEIFILDAGSGIRKLGNKILKEKPQHINILFSHFHWDHIQGFPFFAPVFNKKYSITLIGERKMNFTLEQLFTAQLMFPYFPLSLAELDAKINFQEITAKDRIIKNNVTIKLARLNHPGGCIGYRIEYGGKSFFFSTDTEHFRFIDKTLLKISLNAGVLFYDFNYTDDEYLGKIGFPKKGRGQSTWTNGIKSAKTAKVEKFFLF